jgi:hypothetical protein
MGRRPAKSRQSVKSQASATRQVEDFRHEAVRLAISALLVYYFVLRNEHLRVA